MKHRAQAVHNGNGPWPLNYSNFSSKNRALWRAGEGTGLCGSAVTDPAVGVFLGALAAAANL